MALYNNPYQYSFGVPGQMNQFQQQPVQMPAQPVQQPQQNNNGILWVSGEVGAKSYLVAPGTSVLLMDSESERGRKRDSMGRYSSNDGRMMPDYDRGSSYARRGEHYVRGHYSRSDGRDAYDDYMTQKQSYRSGKSEDCKRKMLAALEEHLDELTTEMSDMSKDAECREERDLVKRYVEKLRDML